MFLLCVFPVFTPYKEIYFGQVQFLICVGFIQGAGTISQAWDDSFRAYAKFY